MKALVFIVALLLGVAQAHAQGATCTAQVAEKKLSGAAKSSFMQKCGKEAKAACEASAKEQKLAGAAKVSFAKKCFEDAVGGKS